MRKHDLSSALVCLTLPCLGYGQTCSTTFSDSFSRPNGPIGNGWSNTTGNSGGNLTIVNGAVSTPGPGGRAGIYRPIDLSKPVIFTATLTQENGAIGLLGRFDADVFFGSNGSLGSGYGLNLYRADQTYADSTVSLVFNGATLGSIASSFQFGPSLTVNLTLFPDKSMTGSVSGQGNVFNFTAPPATLQLSGSNLAIDLGFPDKNSSVITNETVDNVTVGTGCAFPPQIMSAQVASTENSTIAPNTWVVIKGSNLAGTSRPWQGADFVGGQMPVNLDGVSVTINNEPAFVYYISNNQVNVLTPPDLAVGKATVQVTYAGLQSNVLNATVQQASPAIFTFDNSHVVATHLDGTIVGPGTLYPGLSSPASPGETLILYANGFGPTNGTVVKGAISQSGELPALPQITIGGQNAPVGFAGLVSPGLYQFNIQVPLNAAGGENLLSASYSNLTTQPNALITLTLPPGSLSALTLSSSSVIGGQSLTGQVTLSSSAPAGGLDIQLASSVNTVHIPQTVHVASGQTGASFTITTDTVSTTETVTITATSNGTQKVATLIVSPATAQNIFAAYELTISTTLPISGKQVGTKLTVSVPVLGYALVDSTADFSSGELLYAQFFQPTPTGTDRVSFPTVVGSLNSTTITSGSLALTGSSPAVGSTVTGTLIFNAGSNFSINFTGTITASTKIQ